MTGTHLDDAILAQLALGMLDEPERRAPAEHASGCDRCRAALQALDQTFASLGADAPQAAPSDTLRRRVLASAAAPGRHALADLVARTFALAPAEARRVLDLADAPSRWRAGPLPGMARLPFTPGPGLAGARAELLRFGARVPFPRHGHRGVETLVILEGGFTGDDGAHHAEGERLDTLPGETHAFLSDEAGCLAATLLLGELVLEQ